MMFSRDDEAECPCADRPIATYDHVLGVELVVYERAICEEQEYGRPRGGLPADVDIRAYGSDIRASYTCHRYLAAWARRNLFEGVGPR